MGNAESQGMDNASEELGTITHGRARRRRRHLQAIRNELPPTDNLAEGRSWWSTVEHENLVLDQVPEELRSFTDVGRNEDHVDWSSGLLEASISSTFEKNTAISNQSNDFDVREARTTIDAVTNKAEKEYEKFEKVDDLKGNLSGENGSVMMRRDSFTREQSLDEFKEELHRKRLARQTALKELRDEIGTLRKQLTSEQALTQSLRRKYEAEKSVKDTPCQISNEDSAGNTAFAIDADDNDPMSRGRHANIELANAQLALQLANSENISLRAELSVLHKQVGTLKEVISCCKQMLAVKEEQCNELKGKLTEIETSFAEREMKIMSENLRHEYERQLGNIRQLRELYEERQRISAAEHENLQRLVSIKKDELSAEQEKTKNFEERNQTLMKEVESANKELATLREECNEHKFEKKTLKEEMGAVNTLFSQMVMGFNGKHNLDIDRLTTMLEENRSLLNDMATKEVTCADGATLPKLLFELVEQATLSGSSRRSSIPAELEEDTVVSIGDEAAVQDEENIPQHSNENENATVNRSGVIDNLENIDAVDCATGDCSEEKVFNRVSFETTNNENVVPRKQHRRNSSTKTKLTHTASLPTLSSITFTPASRQKLHDPEVIGKVVSAQEIIGNLPKVWKVLTELLSHHNIEQVRFDEAGNSEDCYKSVDTPNGPKAELSVSKTYIKLKDLILEKKSLVKETNRLKTLNSHLECRLNAQEKRLSTVSMELTKTWHLVGKMQRQHRQLHTQEQILRYQLQQKRRLLSELKEELEYCRRKWAAARAKNDESQEQCNDLRREFAKRKLEDANNSAESGYSDSGPPSDDEDGRRRGAAAFGGGVNSCRKHLREMFEHTRKIKRMQSTSPGRAALYGGADGASTEDADAVVNSGNSNIAGQEREIVLRWNSAPPTCGWRRPGNGEDEDEDGAEEAELPPRLLVVSRNSNSGTIPKRNVESEAPSSDAGATGVVTAERATRIQRLEEQCKSLIQQVLETSDNRERLEVQLCRFQDDIAPVQYAVPLEEFINKQRNERMSRASSAPASGSLTAREEEYTRRRSERLGRLEEESRQLMSRIKRTSDRGHYLRCSLDRIRRAPSREESYDSAAEEEAPQRENERGITSEEACEEENPSEKSPLTAEEEAYTARRASRLNRLEEEGRHLLGALSRSTERGNALETKLDRLHERHSNNGEQEPINGGGSGSSIAHRLEDINQVTANRDERLRLLEQESLELIARLSNTSERGTRMINRIAERAERREGRRADATDDSAKAYSIPDAVENAASEEETAATALLPTFKNVACSSIVSDEVTECVTVTTIPSQVAATRELGAIPKSKPAAQLCAARHKSERFTSERKVNDDSATCCSGAESLEEMVKRLRDTPYPEGRNTAECKSNAVADDEKQSQSDGEREREE